MSLVKLAGYFGKEREGHSGSGAAIGAGLGAAALGAGAFLAHRKIKGLTGIGLGTHIKQGVAEAGKASGGRIKPRHIYGAAAGVGALGIGAAGGLGAAVGSGVRTKKEK